MQKLRLHAAEAGGVLDGLVALGSAEIEAPSRTVGTKACGVSLFSRNQQSPFTFDPTLCRMLAK